MKVIGVCGSPRKNGNTELLTKHTLHAIAEEGIETELVRLAGLDIKPCRACDVCKTTGKCATNDDLAPLQQKMIEADGIILATPVYFSSATALMRAFMERTGRSSGRALSGKVGGPLVVARRAGKNFTFAEMTLWFQILGFFIPGSTYWNVAIGREPGDVENDEEGLRTARTFGKNMALLMNKMRG